MQVPTDQETRTRKQRLCGDLVQRKKQKKERAKLLAMASNLIATASNLVAMASNLLAMASNLIESDGLQPNSFVEQKAMPKQYLSHGRHSFLNQRTSGFGECLIAFQVGGCIIVLRLEPASLDPTCMCSLP